jgi:hypothetical protein
MPEYIIRFTGTVEGCMIVEAENLKEAMFKAENRSTKYIDVEGEPSGWEIDEEWTRMDYEEEE